MPNADGCWRVVPEGLAFGNSALSIQRYPKPSNPILREVPSSWGVLPITSDRDHFLVAVPDAEAFWVSLVSPDQMSSFSLVGRSTDGEIHELHRIDVTGIVIWPGFLHRNGYLAFSLDTIENIAIVSIAQVDRISFVTTREFVMRTNEPAPLALGPSDAYEGWRMP